MTGTKGRSTKRPKLEIIEWVDASASVGWMSDEDVAADSSQHVQLCVSVGFLVYEDKNQIILGGTTGANESSGHLESNNRIAVPKAWLRERKRIA